MNVLEKILEELERESKLAHEEMRRCARENPLQFDEVKGYSRAMEYVVDSIRSHMTEKEKVSSAEIISWNIDGKPYYGIKFKKVGEDDYTVGYGSYKLDYVINWLNECFEFYSEVKVSVNVAKDTNVPSNDGWIRSEDRMPEDEEDVLVWFEYFRFGEYQRLFQTVGIGCAWEGEWSRFVNGSSGWRDLRIIAWQPLPEPYKSKKTIPVVGMDHIMSRFTKVE